MTVTTMVIRLLQTLLGPAAYTLTKKLVMMKVISFGSRWKEESNNASLCLPLFLFDE